MTTEEEQLMALYADKIANLFGIKMTVIHVGVSDPGSLFEGYIGFRDKHGNAVGISITKDGEIKVL